MHRVGAAGRRCRPSTSRRGTHVVVANPPTWAAGTWAPHLADVREATRIPTARRTCSRCSSSARSDSSPIGGLRRDDHDAVLDVPHSRSRSFASELLARVAHRSSRCTLATSVRHHRGRVRCERCVRARERRRLGARVPSSSTVDGRSRSTRSAARSVTQFASRASTTGSRSVELELRADSRVRRSRTGSRDRMLACVRAGGRRSAMSLTPRQGMTTGDNDRFLRCWWEVSRAGSVRIGATPRRCDVRRALVPVQQGRRVPAWYGNQEYVVNWENDGREMHATARPRVGRARQQPQTVLPAVRVVVGRRRSRQLAFRYFPPGFIFDVDGHVCYSRVERRPAVRARLSATRSSLRDCFSAHRSRRSNFEVGDMSRRFRFAERSAERDRRLVRRADRDRARRTGTRVETSWDFDVAAGRRLDAESLRSARAMRRRMVGAQLDDELRRTRSGDQPRLSRRLRAR